VSEIPLGSSYLRFFAQGGAVDEPKFADDEPSALINVGEFAGATEQAPIDAIPLSEPNPDNVQIDIAEFYPDLENPVDIEEEIFEAPSAIGSYIQGAVAIPETIGNYFLEPGEEPGDIDFIGGSQLLEDAATMGGAMYEGIKSEPWEFVKDMVPGLGQKRAYDRAEELREDADLLEMEGDFEGAEDLRQMAFLEMSDAATFWPMAAGVGTRAARKGAKADVSQEFDNALPTSEKKGDTRGPLYSPMTSNTNPLFPSAIEGINRLDRKIYTKEELLKALKAQQVDGGGQLIAPRAVTALERWLSDVPSDHALSRSEWLNRSMEGSQDSPLNPSNYGLDVTDPSTGASQLSNLNSGIMRTMQTMDGTEGPRGVGVNRMNTANPYFDALKEAGGWDTPYTGSHFSDLDDVNNITAFSRTSPAQGYVGDVDLGAGFVEPSGGVLLHELQSDLYNKAKPALRGEKRSLEGALYAPDETLDKISDTFAGPRAAYYDTLNNFGIEGVETPEDLLDWKNISAAEADTLAEARKSAMFKKMDAEQAGDIAGAERWDTEYDRLMDEWQEAKSLENRYRDVQNEMKNAMDTTLPPRTASSGAVDYPSLLTGDIDIDSTLPAFPELSRQLEKNTDAIAGFESDKRRAPYALGTDAQGKPNVMERSLGNSDEVLAELRDPNTALSLLSPDTYTRREGYTNADLPTTDFLRDTGPQIDMMLEGSLTEAIRDPNNNWIALPDPAEYSKAALNKTYSSTVPKAARALVGRLNTYYKKTYGIEEAFKFEKVKVEGIVPRTSPEGVPVTNSLDAISWEHLSPTDRLKITRHGLPFSEGGEVSKTAWEEINGY
tara:strand:+ start:366 stop:2867 length:2502 start_codon:yes stop_codon:yes gene_type:complete